MISVSDTGTGIPEDLLSKIFEPFFTTKPHGKGTGLGLSQVYHLIKQSGGQVRIVSAPHSVTTASPYLPRGVGPASAKAEEGGAAPPPVPAPRGQFHVVLVIEAGDATAALSIVGQRADVDLVFSDIGLPGTDGRPLAVSIAAIRPHVRVLLTSGYENQIGGAALSGGVPLLPKPFAVESLSRKIAEVLH